ncbi:patatin-like phospholipase family protein [Sphingomonas zeae]
MERVPFTGAQSAAAAIAGAPEVRFWADLPDAAQRMRPDVPAGQPVTMLALSGGADEGAYGAGVLNGWTQSGTRPEFSVVTGVSTGALIAPFAFLGKEGDASIARFYTSVSARDIFHPRFPLAIPGSTSVASTAPLAKLIAREVTPELVARIAEEQAKGRRLFVATANLDAQRSVIWDMGAIAASMLPDKVELFRRVLLASSSIPVVFPPVVIDASSNGAPVRELHADGGTTAGILAIPPQLAVSDAPIGDAARLHVYLLMNSRLGGDFQMVTPRLVPILKRAFALNQQAALLTLAETSYVYAHRHGIDWNLTFIGNDVAPSDRLFEKTYMRRLYAYGVERGRTGSWRKTPPTPADLAVADRLDHQ